MANQVGQTPEPRLITGTTAPRRLLFSPPQPPALRRAETEGRAEELRRGSGAASCVLVLGQSLLAGEVCCGSKGGGRPSEGRPLPDLQAWASQEKEEMVCKCLLCAYAEHSTLQVALHFIPRKTLR